MKLLTAWELGKILEINVVTVRRWARSGRIPAHEPSRRLGLLRFDADEIFSQQSKTCSAGRRKRLGQQKRAEAEGAEAEKRNRFGMLGI